MHHAFAPAAAELRSLAHKVQYTSYQALFGKTVEERAAATLEASKLNEKLEQTFSQVYDEANSASQFMRGPAKGSQLDSALQFAELIENQQRFAADVSEAMTYAMQSGPCTAMPTAPSKH